MRKLAFSIALCALSLYAKGQKSASHSPHLYPGITEDQSHQAHKALDAFYNGNPKESERLLTALDAIEDRDSLPPLSRLLQVATSVIQIQRDDADNSKEEKRLRKLIADAAAEGIGECQKADKESDVYPTFSLMQGGIQGFQATLKISSNPPKALSEGLGALKYLERALDADSTLMDANMGLGIFRCTAANAPLMIRATLKMMGRQVSLSGGLDILRRSAYDGQYTSVASQLFLIQFLSPYDEELRKEKREIFRSLSKSFPQSAYYTFVRWDESLCFYPDSFYQAKTRKSLEHRIRAVEPEDFSGSRYLNLIKYQYTLINPHPSASYAPDTSMDLHGYSFYPVFVEALRVRKEIMNDSGVAPKAVLRNLKALKDSTLALLHSSGMNPSNIHLFEWHIKDALRSKTWRKKSLANTSDEEDSTED